MRQITIGKMRGLQQIASPQGTITSLALDHRQNLRKANPLFVEDRELSQFKLDVTQVLAPYATSVLLDPEVSAAQAIAQGFIPKQVGLVVAVESTGYDGDATARKARMIPGWSVEKAKRMGASAIKLLVYYHPNSPTAKETEDFVEKIASDCEKHDLTIMLEPLSYSLINQPLSSTEKRQVVIETARRLTRFDIEILKCEFPMDPVSVPDNEWEDALHELDQNSQVPWILLSAAVDYERFADQALMACKAGASGIAVGRAVWKETVTMSKAQRLNFLERHGIHRIERLTALCAEFGVPFTERLSAHAPIDWIQGY